MTSRHDLRVHTLQDALGQPAVDAAAPAVEATAAPNPVRSRHLIDASLEHARRRARIGAFWAGARHYRAERDRPLTAKGEQAA